MQMIWVMAGFYLMFLGVLGGTKRDTTWKEKAVFAGMSAIGLTLLVKFGGSND